VYAEPVAEMALTLALAGMRGFATYARAHDWSPPLGRNLLGARVSILGGGGITESLVRLLQPWDCHITVVRRTANHLDGVDDVLEADRYADALPGADLVVLALALTPETEGIIGADELQLMEDHAWLINVARGRLIDELALRRALESGWIGGAVLDVFSEEPLSPDSPLYRTPNVVITPHTSWASDRVVERSVELFVDNLRRHRAGEPLRNVVDLEAGY
jgi:phosphoglycerate dehydrogenase-like enzyme